MSLLFETIRIENGILMHPEEHEKGCSVHVLLFLE